MMYVFFLLCCHRRCWKTDIVVASTSCDTKENINIDYLRYISISATNTYWYTYIITAT